MIGTVVVGLNATEQTKALQVDASDNLKVSLHGSGGSELGLATEAKQDAIIADLTDGSQLSKAMGSEDGTTSGTQHQVKVGASGNLQVDVVSGGGGGTQYAVGASGMGSGTGTLILASDGGLAQELSANASGELAVQLAPGAATEATLGNIDAATSNTEISVNNIDTKITSGADFSLSSAQQVLTYGRDASGNLEALKIDNSGHLEVVQEPEQNTQVIFSGTQTISSGFSNLFPTALDKNGSSAFNILISATSFDGLDVTVLASDDNVTYYEKDFGFTFFNSTATNMFATFSDTPSRYIKVNITNNTGASVDVTSLKGTYVKGI
jgi:hypothetical protein